MIPTRQELAEISRLREGRLAEVSFAVLLHALAVHERTVVIEVRRRQLEKKIVMEFGVPVDCRSNLVHETLGRFLVTAGRLTEEEFQAALGQSASRGVQLGEVLLELRLISPSDLFKLLQQNLAKKLLDVFTWRDGEFRLAFDVPTVDSSLKVKVPQLVVTGVTKFAPQEEVDAGVGPLVGKKLALDLQPPSALDDIKLTDRQAAVVEALREPRRLDELAAAGLPFNELTRLIYALAVLGTVVPAERLPLVSQRPAPVPPGPAPATTGTIALVAAAEPPGATAAPSATVTPFPRPAAPPPAAPSLPQAEVERVREELMGAYLSYRRQDAFDLLGVPEEATTAAIAEKYLEFARRFAPWQLTAPDLGALAEKARDLFLAGARAYAELADTEQRNTLLFRRKTLREERAKRPPQDFAIKTDLLDPEVQYRKGKALMDAGKYREAVLLLEFAADCDPGNGLYRAELAWSRYLASPATAGKQALADLDEAMRVDPRCGLATFYAGQINAELGNRAEAERHLQRAIKLMAPDRRPIEALKALQVAKKR